MSDGQDDVVVDRRSWVDEQVRAGADAGSRRRSDTRRAGPQHPRGSLALHRLGRFSSHSGAGLAAAAFVLVWLVVGGIAGFPDWWETVLYSTSAAVTLVMVFAIQHTQSRQQLATQRKLDELLRAVPTADDHLIASEGATYEELQARGDLNTADRAKVTDP